jgi:hypothetical protein
MSPLVVLSWGGFKEQLAELGPEEIQFLAINRGRGD